MSTELQTQLRYCPVLRTRAVINHIVPVLFILAAYKVRRFYFQKVLHIQYTCFLSLLVTPIVRFSNIHNLIKTGKFK